MQRQDDAPTLSLTNIGTIGDGGEKTMLYNADKTKAGIWYLAHLVSDYKSGTDDGDRFRDRPPDERRATLQHVSGKSARC